MLLHQLLTLAIVAFGFYVVLWATLGPKVIKTHPATLLARALRGLVIGMVKAIGLVLSVTIDLVSSFVPALITGGASHSGTGGTSPESPFLEGRAKRKLINRWHSGGLTVDGKRKISQDNSYRHLLLVSPTGGGKTSRYCIPAILHTTGASLIVTDAGGALHRLTSGSMQSRGYTIRVLNFTDPSRSERFNPLGLASSHTEIDMVSHLLVETSFPNAGGEQSFWSQGATEITSVLLKCLKKESKKYHNLANLRYLLNRFETYGRPLYHFVDRNADEQVFHQFRSFISQDLKVLQGMLSTAKAALSKFSDPQLCLLTSESTFLFSELRHTPTIVYLIVREDQVSYYSFILTLFYSQLFSMCMQLPEDDSSALPVMCILEEAGNMGKLPNFSTAITSLRRRRTSCSLILQDLGQLEDLYGRAGAKVIINSCASRLFLPGLPHETCKRIEEMLGRQEDEKGRLRSVMTASQIRTLPDGKAIYVFANKKPALIDITPYYRYRKLRKRTKIPPAPLPHAPDLEVAYLDLTPTASDKSQQTITPNLGDKRRGQDSARSRKAGVTRRSETGAAHRGATTHTPASSGTSGDAGIEQASSIRGTASGELSPVSSPSPSPAIVEEKSTSTAEAEEPDTTAHRSPHDQAHHGTQRVGSTPPWAGELLQESRRARQEIETLRHAVQLHVISRKEAATLLGVSSKTLQRWERKGILERVAVSSKTVHYAMDSILKLKQGRS